jgi:hypothetical protein
MEGLAQTSKIGNALPATLAAIAATTSGTIIDTVGFEGLLFEISVGTFATFTGVNSWTFKIEQSDSATFAAGNSDLAVLDYLRSHRADGTEWDRICDAAGDAAAVFRIAAKIPTAARRRYMRLVLTLGGTVSAAAAATFTLYNARHAPV